MKVWQYGKMTREKVKFARDSLVEIILPKGRQRPLDFIY